MINKQQAILDIRNMNDKQKYAHILSCLDIVLKKKNDEAHKDATTLVRLHISMHNQASMETAKMSYA